MRRSRLPRCHLLVLLVVLMVPAASQAFQVLPRISDVDRQLGRLGSHSILDGVGQWVVGSVLPQLKNPVHEAITLKALGCPAAASDESSCVTTPAILEHRTLLYGVRWPDDPPFALNRASPPRLPGCNAAITLRSTAQPLCWKGLFGDAEKTAKQRLLSRPDVPAFGPGDYLLYRSHFGDLQFFHAMAARDGEPASQTRQRMKMWSQLLWGLATRTLATDQFIRTLQVEGLATYFPGDMTATNLLATGIVEVRKNLDQVALGALLHMVQDSFSQAHAGRLEETGAVCSDIPRFLQPGKLRQFYSYGGQLGSLHDHEDTFKALGIHTLQVSPNVVDASQAFLTLWQEGAPWSEAEKYFECAFTLEDPDVSSGPGPFTH